MYSLLLIIFLGLIALASVLLSIYLIYCFIKIKQNTDTIVDFCIWYSKKGKDDDSNSD